MDKEILKIKQTLPSIKKYLIAKYGTVENGFRYIFNDYVELFCPCCNTKLEKQGTLFFDKNKKLNLKKPYRLACLHSSCDSSKIKVASIEYKTIVLGMNKNELLAQYAKRIAKGVKAKRKNGYYDDKSNNPYSQEFWIKKGYSEKEAQELLNKKASKMVETKRKNGYYDDKSNNPYSQEFWIKKGYSEKEAQLKIKNKNHNCKEYWVKRGYSPEESTELAKNSAATNSITEIIKRHGEKNALTLYKERGIKMSKSWNISSTRHQKFGTSKSATLFFTELSTRLLNLELASNVIFKHEHSKYEWFIYDKKLFFYDCFIKDFNLLIEYNGEHVHPRKEKLSIEEWSLWRHAFSKKTADEVYEIDLQKQNIAKKHNYKIMYVWSKDVIIDQELELNNIINYLRN